METVDFYHDFYSTSIKKGSKNDGSTLKSSKSYKWSLLLFPLLHNLPSLNTTRWRFRLLWNVLTPHYLPIIKANYAQSYHYQANTQGSLPRGQRHGRQTDSSTVWKAASVMERSRPSLIAMLLPNLHLSLDCHNPVTSLRIIWASLSLII